jgi:hypothetical protein
MNVNEMLDEVMVRHEAMADPLQRAGADQIVDDFLRKPGVKARLKTDEPAPKDSAKAKSQPSRNREKA